MDIFNNAMLHLLNIIYGFVGSYGWAIVILTVLIRVVLWPLNDSQAKSMKKMQELQPKIRAIQDSHKNDPQKMQAEMMKFYSEHKFNPFAGCLPMIVQLPIFIGLFGALSSPMFLMESVHENFFFVDKLYHTLRSHAGEPLDQAFDVKANDKFAMAKEVTITLADGVEVKTNVGDIHKALHIQPSPVIPGQPMTVELNLDELPEGKGLYDQIESVDSLMINDATKEVESAAFTKQKVVLKNDKGLPVLNAAGDKQYTEALVATIPTNEGKDAVQMDVAILIGLYGILTLLYQKVMSPPKPKTAEGATDAQADAQAKMMKVLPLMFILMLVFIPIPAGVMLYLVVTTGLMFIQQAMVNMSDKKKDLTTNKPGEKVIEVKAE